MFQFTPGCVAGQFDSNYRTDRYNGDAKIKLDGVRHYEYGYGTWASAVPNALDYWPKNAPDYRTITSGYKITLTIGNTSSAGGSGGEDGFEVSVDSKLNSSLKLEYYYQETYTESNPRMSSQFLPNTTGGSWLYTNFSEPASTKTFTSYPGLLFETIVPSSYPGRIIGDVEVTTGYVVWGSLGIRYNLDFSEVINLKKY